MILHVHFLYHPDLFLYVKYTWEVLVHEGKNTLTSITAVLSQTQRRSPSGQIDAQRMVFLMIRAAEAATLHWAFQGLA